MNDAMNDGVETVETAVRAAPRATEDEAFSLTPADRGLGVPEELSSLGGALYVAAVKTVTDPSWDAGYLEYLETLRSYLLSGALDESEAERSCLVELSAVQISAPALERGYERTAAAVDAAAQTLGLDAEKLTEPKYISLGSRFAAWINAKPKRLMAAVIAAGLLFAGPNGVLLGPGAASADTSVQDVADKISSAVTHGLEVNRRGGNYRMEYDGDYVQRRVEKIGADVAEDLVSGLIKGTVDGIFGSITGVDSGGKKAGAKVSKVSGRAVADALYSDKFKLSKSEQAAALAGAFVLNHIPGGLTAKEILLSTMVISPELSTERLTNIAECICSMATYDKESESFKIPSTLRSQLAFQMGKKDSDFNETEAVISFLSKAAGAAKEIVMKGGELDDSYKSLLAKAQEAFKDVYSSPVASMIVSKISFEKDKGAAKAGLAEAGKDSVDAGRRYADGGLMASPGL